MTDGRQNARVRSTLVVVEVALATVLLVGAGLLLRSFVHILDVDLGFQPSRATSVRLETSSTLDDNARRARLFDAARRVSELPGVEATGLTDALPLDRNRTWNVAVPGQTSRRSDVPALTCVDVCSAGLQACSAPCAGLKPCATYGTGSSTQMHSGISSSGSSGSSRSELVRGKTKRGAIARALEVRSRQSGAGSL